METESAQYRGDPLAAGRPVPSVVRRPPRIIASLAWIPPLLVVGALWWASLPFIDPYSLTDFGLVASLPWQFFAALVLLTFSYVMAVRSPFASTPVLLLHVVVLILVLHGTLPIVYDMPRYTYTYKHIGVVDYIQRHGSVDPNIDIYHNWPGFFALVAMISGITGVSSVITLAGWAPVLFEVLYLLPLLMLYQSCTRDRRLVWTGVWIFYLANWIGQDYFSPQALSYFLYIAILAIILRWFKPAKPPRLEEVHHWIPVDFLARRVYSVLDRAHDRGSASKENTRATLSIAYVTVLLAFAVIVSSHQLTPFAVILGTTALVVFRGSSARAMPLLMVAMVIFWLNSMAGIYMSAKLPAVTEGAGRLFQNVSANVSDISQSSPGRVFAAMSSRLLTGTVWLIALAGIFRRARAGFWDLPVIILAVSPIILLAGQSYGGEMGFRVYLFTLPFVAFLAAGALYPSPSAGSSTWSALTMVLLSTLLTAGFCSAHYGNERMNFVTPREVAACDYLYENAEPGSLILAGAVNTPAMFLNYESYVHQWLTEWPDYRGRELGTPADVAALELILADERYPAAYLIITRGQKEYLDLMGVSPRGALANLENALIQSGRFEIALDTGDAKVFTVDRER